MCGDFMEIQNRKDLLNEYEIKRRIILQEADDKKMSFKNEHPDFAKLENDFSKKIIESPEKWQQIDNINIVNEGNINKQKKKQIFKKSRN